MRRKKYTKTKKFGKFKSGLEKQIWDKLVRVKKKNCNFQYEGEKLKYFVPKEYNPDITLTFPAGRKIHIEIKGYLRYEDQVKMRYVKVSHPETDIRFVFAQDNKVQGSKMTCSQWCNKYGFKYHIGELPKSWLQ